MKANRTEYDPGIPDGLILIFEHGHLNVNFDTVGTKDQAASI